MNQLPIEYLSSVCEVKTLENELLSTGVITRVTADDIDISGRTGLMPLLRFRDEVKLSIFNHKYGFRILTGLIYISNHQFMRVFDIQNILDYERRYFFRVDTTIPAHIHFLREDTVNEPPIDAVISNLSLGGALVTCHKELVSDEIIQLRFAIDMKAFVFTSRIHRIEQKGPDLWACGCEFLDYSSPQSDALCSFLFQCQRSYIKNI